MMGMYAHIHTKIKKDFFVDCEWLALVADFK
jgi:hypothetical protein